MFKNYFQILLEVAQKSGNLGEVPVACIAVLDGKIIASSGNLVEKKKNKMLHAEMIVISKLQKKFRSSNFLHLNLSLYITLEPCCMCTTAIAMCGIKNVFYMVEDKKFGGVQRIYTEQSAYFKPNFFFIENTECCEMLQNFFRKIRENVIS